MHDLRRWRRKDEALRGCGSWKSKRRGTSRRTRSSPCRWLWRDQPDTGLPWCPGVKFGKRRGHQDTGDRAVNQEARCKRPDGPPALRGLLKHPCLSPAAASRTPSLDLSVRFRWNSRGLREAYWLHQRAAACFLLLGPTSGRPSGMNPSRFGIRTWGNDFASITSFSPMIPFRNSRYADTA